MRAVMIIIGVVLLCLVPSMALAATFDVAIVEEGFNPSAITIREGDTVRWTNRGTTLHGVSRGGQFGSGLLSPGVSFEYTFTSSGDVQYDLMNFPYPFTEITGKITVLGGWPVSISPGNSVVIPEQNIDLYISLLPWGNRFQIIFDGAVVFDGDYQNLLTFFKSLDNNARAVPGGSTCSSPSFYIWVGSSYPHS